MRTLLTALTFLAILKGEPPRAQEVGKIAAVVNDDAITMSDLEARLRLAMVAANLPDSPEARERLTPQVLRGLVDEQIELQEAKRLGLKIESAEVTDYITRLAMSNNMTREKFIESLARQGVNVGTLEHQARAQIAWSKVVQRVLRPRIDVRDEEIDDELAHIKDSADKPQYLVSEIFLTVDNPSQDNQTHAFANKLVDDIRHGASFVALARQFSQAAGAANGGDIGFVEEGQLEPELDKTLRTMQVGQISEPVRSVSGYHILLLRKKSKLFGPDPMQATVSLKQIMLPFQAAPGADGSRVVAQAEQMRAGMRGCGSVDAYAREHADGLSGDLGQNMKVSELPGPVAQVVGDLPVGQLSQPLRTDGGVIMLMVCNRVDGPPSEPPTRDAVMNQLGMQQLDQQQRRYLRDLRSAAYVDIRV